MNLDINIYSVTGETDFNATCDLTTTESPAANELEPGKMYVTRQQVHFHICRIMLKQRSVCRIRKLFGNICRRILLGQYFLKLPVNGTLCTSETAKGKEHFSVITVKPLI